MTVTTFLTLDNVTNIILSSYSGLRTCLSTPSQVISETDLLKTCVFHPKLILTIVKAHSSKKYYIRFMAIKIDFEKAYDRLRWSFIRGTLLQMNLPLLLVNIIMECVTTSSLQVLWNGDPSQKFKPSRGIRQGDPLSPYLFVMCMERFYQVIEEAIVAKTWQPIRASRNGPLLSNLFFADDIVLFAEANCEQAHVIKHCLERFCDASGQKVSLPKSRVYFSNNVSDPKQLEISSCLGMEATTDLGMYLGMPSLTSRVTRETFGHLCEKIDRRLSGWKTKYLSLAGRITLAKSTLSTIACYSMQTAKIPRTICDDIDRKTRRFVWGGNEEKRATHLLAWETLQKPRNHGGVGLRSARQANSAFLSKLGWRVLTEPNTLWSWLLEPSIVKGDVISICLNPRRGCQMCGVA